MNRPSADQWRAAADALRSHAAIFDKYAAKADEVDECGLIMYGPCDEPVRCAFPRQHEGKHSWAWARGRAVRKVTAPPAKEQA